MQEQLDTLVLPDEKPAAGGRSTAEVLAGWDNPSTDEADVVTAILKPIRGPLRQCQSDSGNWGVAQRP